MNTMEDYRRFSERAGLNPPKTMQLDEIDDDLSNGLWNVFYLIYLSGKSQECRLGEDDFFYILRCLWIQFYKRPVDLMENISHSLNSITDHFKRFFLALDWKEKYDYVDFVAHFDKNKNRAKYFREQCNIIFKTEVSGYRFIDKTLSPITNEIEIVEIEKALVHTQSKGLTSVNDHLRKAQAHFSDRETPDYENSIKESISAVESMAKLITGDPNATLGKALDDLAGQINLHPALKEGLRKIYGWTSDEGGIRHSNKGGNQESKDNFEEAYLMIVFCSSLVNFLIQKAEKAGMKFKIEI